MDKPLNQEITRYLLNSNEFNQYIQWVTDVMSDLDSVSGIVAMTNEQAGEEVRVRAKAIQILNNILSPFIEYRTKREVSVDEVQKAKENYGL